MKVGEDEEKNGREGGGEGVMASPQGLDWLFNSSHQTESQRQMERRRLGLAAEDRGRKKAEEEVVLYCYCLDVMLLSHFIWWEDWMFKAAQWLLLH